MPKANKSKSMKIIHPNSRTAGYMKRQNAHFEKVFKSKSVTSEKNERLRQKLQWFQENLDPHKAIYTRHDLALLTSEYLDRFKGELEQISIINSIGHRKSKQHVSRSEAIRLTQEREKKEFEAGGVEVPNLLNKVSCDYLRNWTGEIRYFPNIKLSVSRKQDIQKVKMVNNQKKNDKAEEEVGTKSDKEQNAENEGKDSIVQEKLDFDNTSSEVETMDTEALSTSSD